MKTYHDIGVCGRRSYETFKRVVELGETSSRDGPPKEADTLSASYFIGARFPVEIALPRG
jgi:hypothetical protein